MKLLRQIITIVCLVASFVANAGEQLTANAKCAANQPTISELQLLQGTWEGVLVGDKAQQKITITITGNSLHFHRDTNFWWKTTITLPADTNPRQLHATIQDCHDCPPQQENSNGTVAVAIFKVEDGKLTLATGNGDGEAPKSFEAAPNRYELRKVQPQKKMSGSGPGLLALEGHELHASLFTQAGIAQSSGTFTDSRDGQTYKTVSFKNALTGATGYLDGPKPELQSAGELRL